MGGYWGEVRGSTKIETYLAYVEQCEGWPGTHDPDPSGKKWCYRQMERDPQTGEWTLRYRAHK